MLRYLGASTFIAATLASSIVAANNCFPSGSLPDHMTPDQPSTDVLDELCEAAADPNHLSTIQLVGLLNRAITEIDTLRQATSDIEAAWEEQKRRAVLLQDAAKRLEGLRQQINNGRATLDQSRDTLKAERQAYHDERLRDAERRRQVAVEAAEKRRLGIEARDQRLKNLADARATARASTPQVENTPQDGREPEKGE